MEKVFIDYYKLLGLREDASDEEIREIYRIAIKECHPDIHAQEDERTRRKAENAARLLNEMRATLLNPERRKAYDAERTAYYENLKNQDNSKDSKEHRDRFDDEPYVEKDDVLTPEEALDKIVEAFKKAREEEKAYPLLERHKDIGLEYNETVGTVVENKAVRSIAGLGAHVTQEIVFQLAKLRHRKGESFLDYTMRNRRNFAAFLVAFSIFTSSLVNKNEKVEYNSPVETVQDISEDQTQLTRYYTIKDGDNLSSLAYDAGISVEKLAKINGIEGSIIYTGDKIKVPYNISESDLVYYAEMVDVEGRSLDEIAKLYETDVQTLMVLNGNAIGTENGYQEALTDQIFVPNFIGKDMLQVLKTENQIQNKNESNHL